MYTHLWEMCSCGDTSVTISKSSYLQRQSYCKGKVSYFFSIIYCAESAVGHVATKKLCAIGTYGE